MKSVFTYELAVEFLPTLPEKTKNTVWTGLMAFLDAMKISLGKQENMGVKELAYPIAGSRKAELIVCPMECAKPIDTKTISVYLNREANIIRYLILKK